MSNPPSKNRANIKVCILEPGLQDEEIRCTLQTLDLHDSASSQVEYEALSYVWGDPEDTLPITIDAKTAHVTRNLHTALLQLRDEQVMRTLWIDATCINQKDPEERREQVKLMGDIYASATRTLVWLGEEKEEDCRALPIIREVVEHEASKNDELRHAREYYNPCNLTITPEDLCAADLTEICALLERPWFERVWVIQEVVNANAVAVICGKETIAWSWLTCIIFSLGVQNFHAVLTEVTSKLDDRYFTGMVNVLMIDQMRFSGRVNPFTALNASKNFISSDPRDMIFGVLGLMEINRKHPLFEPDYTATYEEVLERHSRYNLEVLRQLDQLSFIPLSHQQTPIRIPSIPFWTIDWCKLRSIFDGAFHVSEYRIIDKEDDLRAQLFIRMNGSELHIRGRRIGTLLKIANASLALDELAADENVEWEDVQEVLQDYFDFYSGSVQSESTLWEYLSSNDSDNFIRVLVCDDTSKQNYVSQCRQYLLVLIDPSTNCNAFRNAHAVLNKRIGRSQYRFARLSDGRVGWVKESTVADDLVCILYGARFPFVLRPTDDGRYRIICDCWVSAMKREKADSETQDKDEVFIVCE